MQSDLLDSKDLPFVRNSFLSGTHTLPYHHHPKVLHHFGLSDLDRGGEGGHADFRPRETGH